MKRCLGGSLVGSMALLVVSGVTLAAEPAKKPAKSVAIQAPAGTPAAAPATAPAANPQRGPLDLRIGNVRSYMMPREYASAIGAPDADANTVVVEGQRSLPLKSDQPIPGGFPPATLWWALRNPTQSWRILMPDLKAPPAPPPGPIPPPVFRWGP